jgi:hypothetical protein
MQMNTLMIAELELTTELIILHVFSRKDFDLPLQALHDPSTNNGRSVSLYMIGYHVEETNTHDG